METILRMFPSEDDRAAELQGALSTKFAINTGTDWDELATCADLLSIVMTDLGAYTHDGNNIDGLIEAMGLVTSKIGTLTFQTLIFDPSSDAPGAHS